MKLCFIITFLVINFSFAESIFFENLKEKSTSQQRILLQKRMNNDSVAIHRLTTVENVDFYFKLNLSIEDKFTFIERLLKKSPQDDFRQQTIIGMIRACRDQLQACMPRLMPYLICKTVKECEKRNLVAQELFAPENIEVILKQRATFMKIIEQYPRNKAAAGIAYINAINFGFLGQAEQILQSEKSIEKDPIVIYSICTFFMLKKNYDSAEKCLEGQTPGPWVKLGKGYIEILRGRVLRVTDYESTFKELRQENGAKPRQFAIAMEGLLLKRKIENLADSDIEGLAKDYWSGYMLLSINKKFKVLDEKIMRRLEGLYFKNFSSTLLVRIYKGMEGSEILRENLGENSYLYQAST